MKKKVLLTILASVTICVIYFGIQFKEVFDVLRQVGIAELDNSSESMDSDNLIDEPIVSDVNNNPENVDSVDNVDASKDENNDDVVDNMDNVDKNEEEIENTKPVSNQNTSTKTNEKPNENPQENQKQPEKSNTVLSDEKISNVENSISMADKAKAVKLILSKLSSDDIKMLKGLASGGLTAEEKKKAVKIAYSKYSAEEIAIIKELYNKYVK